MRLERTRGFVIQGDSEGVSEVHMQREIRFRFCVVAPQRFFLFFTKTFLLKSLQETCECTLENAAISEK